MVFRADMQTVTIKKGLDIPIAGQPEQVVRAGRPVHRVGLVGADYPGLKPTMLVSEGDRVRLGQPLFTDKANPEVQWTAPGCGAVEAIRRGAKRAFEAVVIRLDGDDQVTFPEAAAALASKDGAAIRRILLASGLWCSFRTRPFGKVAAAAATPASLFVTAIDTDPLAADPLVIIDRTPKRFRTGLRVLRALLSVPIHLCSRPEAILPGADLEGITSWGFRGPHPAGLPSTHIHYIDPVHAGKQVWHVDARDVIAIGHLFTHGRLSTERIVALGGPGAVRPGLLATRQGAALAELCQGELAGETDLRLLSGSVLDGRPVESATGFLGRYHRQVSVLLEGDGRSLFAWLTPGSDRFSVTRLFASTLGPGKRFAFLTAVWGGHRAIYPLGVYDRVLPLDMIATTLLKTLAIGDCEKAAELGCLELIEEDLALCSFVCPGKNEFGPMLRRVLTAIEEGA